jgi:hypothetical protein
MKFGIAGLALTAVWHFLNFSPYRSDKNPALLEALTELQEHIQNALKTIIFSICT